MTSRTIGVKTLWVVQMEILNPKWHFLWVLFIKSTFHTTLTRITGWTAEQKWDSIIKIKYMCLCLRLGPFFIPLLCLSLLFLRIGVLPSGSFVTLCPRPTHLNDSLKLCVCAVTRHLRGEQELTTPPRDCRVNYKDSSRPVLVWSVAVCLSKFCLYRAIPEQVKMIFLDRSLSKIRTCPQTLRQLADAWDPVDKNKEHDIPSDSGIIPIWRLRIRHCMDRSSWSRIILMVTCKWS